MSSNKTKIIIMVFAAVLISLPVVSLVSMLNNFKALPNQKHIYQKKGYLALEAGTIAAWVQLSSRMPSPDRVILSTDDARVALYVETKRHNKWNQAFPRIAARAGGNQQAMVTSKDRVYPEAAVNVKVVPEDTDFSKGLPSSPLDENGNTLELFGQQWFHVAMTYSGYPQGVVELYIDGELLDSFAYDQTFSDTRSQFETFSVNIRPPDWPAPSVGQEGGVEFDQLMVKPAYSTATEIAALHLKALTKKPGE